jgi:hypothetical protein
MYTAAYVLILGLICNTIRCPPQARLVDASGKPVFTDKECAGIGKNYMKVG